MTDDERGCSGMSAFYKYMTLASASVLCHATSLARSLAPSGEKEQPSTVHAHAARRQATCDARRQDEAR